MKNKRPGRKRPPGPKARDLGLQVEAGKGDAARNCFSKEFRENFDEIQFSKSDEGFIKVSQGVKVKVYK